MTEEEFKTMAVDAKLAMESALKDVARKYDTPMKCAFVLHIQDTAIAMARDDFDPDVLFIPVAQLHAHLRKVRLIDHKAYSVDAPPEPDEVPH